MRMSFLLRYLLPLFFITFTVLQSKSQIAAWDFTGQNTGPATVAATTFNANLVSAAGANNITRGAGAAASTANNSFRTVGFKNDGIAVVNTDYFQVTIGAQTGYSVSLSSIDARVSGTQTYVGTLGVSNQFAYSLDGSNFTLIGTPSVVTGTVPLLIPTIDLTGIAALQNVAAGTTVTLRFYATGQTATGGWGFFSSAAGINGLAVGGTLIAANPIPTTTSISPGTANAGSAGFPLTVNGTNFINGASTVTWNSANRTTTFVSTTQLTATIPASDILSAGAATVGVTNTGAPAASNTQIFTINPAVGPAVSLTSALADFGSVCINTTSASSSFTIDGSNLDGSPVVIGALSGFAYSLTSGGTYTSTLNVTYTGNGFTGKVIYVKFSPAAVQSYNGAINLTGGGITPFPVNATGAGVNTPPAVTTGVSSNINATGATVAGTINTAGCAAITAYGIEYSLISGFADGTGTKVPAANLSAGNYSVTFTGFVPNTRYYYKAYATSSAGTSYGTQQAFTNTPLPVKMSSQPALTYTETFADISNWSNFFISGIGANHYTGLSATVTTGIPTATSLSTSTSSFQSGNPGTSGGVQRGTEQVTPIPATESIILLSTGSTDNSSSSAIDLYLDFTGLNAGSLSFDYQTFSNALATGANDRTGSLRVYASTDGLTFTELTGAAVLNFVNNTPASGSVVNITLPASFNSSPTARLRFYYYNGTGGTSGSRPKMSIDNIKVTAIATAPCVRPTTAAVNLSFGTITDVSIQGSFSPSTPSSDEYLVVMSNNSGLTGNPVDRQAYTIGDNVGDGTVVSVGQPTNFTVTGLSPLTAYYFFVFPLNSLCVNGPLYYTASILNGTATTIAGLPTCAAPVQQPTSLVLNATSTNTVQGSFTATTASEYLVLRSTSATLTANPVNGQLYNKGDAVGNAVVVQRANATGFTSNDLLSNTQYRFFVFSANSAACINGPVYNTVSPLNGTATTQPLPPCAAPILQASTLLLSASNTKVSGTFVAAPGADNYLVIRSLSPALSASPVNGTDYATGTDFGAGIVLASGKSTSFLASNLLPNTTYYFFVFSSNKNCSGGTAYAALAPLSENITTSNTVANNYYFGTLHSHSDYSDGNQDNPGYTPADDYNYAMSALCMDYLGISEHNHFSSPDNPGNKISTYKLGLTQAKTFSTAHPNFLAMYGMEWGVISGGGHVVIYGDGMDNLFGWETGSGGWGPTNNYDVYVPKNVYTGSAGLFKTINDNIATNTFATLAHPNLTDFNGIGNTVPYDVVADNAIVGSTVESGPASSTNTTYTNPASSMSYLWYFQTLLAKGYHLGPTIDHDNHKTTFGKTTTSRTAIVAPALTKTEIVKAMRNMHFYATQDCDSKVDFTINSKLMGSAIMDRFGPNISVTLTDATTSTSAAVIRVMFGIPGSGVLPVKIDSAIGNTLNTTDNNLANLATGYYYIDITNGTGRIITSPIWYTRYDAAFQNVKFSSFTIQKIDNSAALNWSTEQETGSSQFIIERSVDGRTWNSIGTVTAAGNSTNRINYSYTDNKPLRGINYYRIKLTDTNSGYDYSAVRSATFNSKYFAQIAPNPVKDIINLYLVKTGNSAATVELLNAEGRMVYQTSSSQSLIQIRTGGLSKGLYFVKVTDADNVTTLKVLLQ